MPFTTAVKNALLKWRQLSGRASRNEFWSFDLFAVVALGASYVLSPALLLVVWLGLIIPYYAVIVRRLHDTGHSGWALLLTLIPYAGFIVLFWLAKDGQAGDNRYGPHPYRPGGAPYLVVPASWAPPREDAGPGALWSSE